jgi:hypothetical protein
VPLGFPPATPAIDERVSLHRQTPAGWWCNGGLGGTDSCRTVCVGAVLRLLCGCAVALAFVLVVLQGSAAARADWVQWAFGVLLVSAVVSGLVAVARRAQVRERLAE